MVMSGKATKKVLICDDEPLIREAISYAVEKAGYQFVLAEDGVQAFEMVVSENPDLVLLDVGMPGISGFDVCKKIRELPGGDKFFIMIVSAFGQAADKEKAAQSGADDYLSKPFSPRDLVAKLESILSSDVKK